VASSTLGLLGVTFDRTLALSPHSEEVATLAKQRAGVVARLAHYVPRGRYLRQLAQGLFVGKLGHALPAVVAPRLQGEDGKGSRTSVYEQCLSHVDGNAGEGSLPGR
jgi:hypothetical protein